MDKPKISIHGAEFESGFVVEFDENFNLLINKKEYPSWVLSEIGARFEWEQKFAFRQKERLEKRKANRKENALCERKERQDFWHQISFKPEINTRIERQGIYIIDNVYVGKSIHILNRIKQHVQLAINNKHVNKRLESYIKEKLFNERGLHVRWIDCESTHLNEAIAINQLLKNGHKLLNSDLKMLSLLNQTQPSAQ